jgi:hypothetical protein
MSAVIIRVLDPPPVIVKIDQPQVTIKSDSMQGFPGIRGPQGEQGIPGVSGANFVFDQMVASDTWVITHNLGRYPSVTVVDSSGEVVEGDVRYTDANSLTIYFSAAFAGMAYLN